MVWKQQLSTISHLNQIHEIKVLYQCKKLIKLTDLFALTKIKYTLK